MTAPAALKPLTPKQAVFVREWPKDHNGQQAAIRAGVSVTRAKVTASEWLALPQVKAALAVTERNVAVRAEKTAADISKAAWVIIENGEEPASARVSALSLEAKRFPEYRDGPVIDQSQHVHLPEGLTIEELRALAGRR